MILVSSRIPSDQAMRHRFAHREAQFIPGASFDRPNQRKQRRRINLIDTTLLTALTVFLATLMLATCAVKVLKDDDASEALTVAEAKLCRIATYDAEISAVEAWRAVRSARPVGQTGFPEIIKAPFPAVERRP